MAKLKVGHRRGSGKPHPVDVYVGVRVRQCRTLNGMTQTDLGDALGLTFQQVQQYERGTNRISSSRLYGLSQLFDVPVEYFFEDAPPEVAAGPPAAKKRGTMNKLPSYEPDPMDKRETLELVRAYYKIEDTDIRKRVYEVAKALGAAAGKDG